jgi:hypothetical protein
MNVELDRLVIVTQDGDDAVFSIVKLPTEERNVGHKILEAGAEI